MIEKLLNLKDAAAILNLGTQKTARLLHDYKVPYIEFGSGRGNGKRWRYSSIINLMQVMEEETSKRLKKSIMPKKKSVATIFPDKSIKGILSVLYPETKLQ